MNWKNIKTLIILLLVFANIFLVFMLARTGRTDKHAKEAAEDAAEILLRSGISVSTDILTNNVEDLPLCTVSFANSTNAITKLFFDGEVTEKFAIPDGVAFFSDKNELLKLCGSSIYYTSDATNIEDITLSNDYGSAPDNETSELLERLLTPSGTGSEEFGFDIISSDTSGRSVTLCVIQTLDGVKIENHTLTCKIIDGKLTYASGKWCFLPISKKSSAHLLDKTNILFIEKNNLEFTDEEADETVDTAEKSDFQKAQKTVKSINSCYYSATKSDGSLLYILPSYTIEWQDGSSSHYNAISGEKVN